MISSMKQEALAFILSPFMRRKNIFPVLRTHPREQWLLEIQKSVSLAQTKTESVQLSDVSDTV